MSIIDALVQKAFSQQRQTAFNGRASNPTTTAQTIREQISTGKQPPLQPQTVVVINETYGKQTFQDPRNAALFTLLSTGVTLVDFLNWAATERSTMLVSPLNAAPDASWKFLLLQDNSLAGFVLAEPPKSGLTPSTLPTCSSSNCSNSNSDNAENSSFAVDSNTANIPLSQVVKKKKEIPVVEGQSKTTTVRSAAKSGKRKTNEPLSASPPPPETTGNSVKKKRMGNSETHGTSSIKARGSARRISELEGVTDCPDCKKKGQSIFDPNNWNADGMVWQYFYCRNQECPKGKSTNRYIGWTVRARDLTK